MNNTDSIKLNYRVSGKGRPVVFLHGFLESISMWEYLNLSKFQSILIDLPGHGQSSIDEGESIDSMAQKVRAVIEEVGIEEYSVVGHSMGGYVGLKLLGNDPKCERLLLLNSNFWADSEKKKIDRFRVSQLVMDKKVPFIKEAIPNLFHDASLYERAVEQLIEEASLIEAKAIAICSLAMRDRLDEQKLMTLRKNDVCMIQGNNDPIVPSSRMKDLCKEIGIRYHEVASGHMSHIECTEELNQILNSEV